MPAAALTWYPDIVARRAAVSRAVDRAGTPVYLATPDILLDRYRALQHALARSWPDAVVAYSFKTNYQVAATRVLQRAGAWADVIEAETDKDAAHAAESGGTATSPLAKRSASVVARAIVSEPMPALENTSLIEIQNWRDADERKVKRIQGLLSAVGQLPPALLMELRLMYW